jgi:hypothetical protein
MEPHPRFHRGGTFYSAFPARHAWCQAWQAGTPARPSDAEHLQDAKYGAACPGLSGESRYQKAHLSPEKPGLFRAPGYTSPIRKKRHTKVIANYFLFTRDKCLLKLSYHAVNLLKNMGIKRGFLLNLLQHVSVLRLHELEIFPLKSAAILNFHIL